jgi:hypothetical protein
VKADEDVGDTEPRRHQRVGRERRDEECERSKREKDQAEERDRADGERARAHHANAVEQEPDAGEDPARVRDAIGGAIGGANERERDRGAGGNCRPEGDNIRTQIEYCRDLLTRGAD